MISTKILGINNKAVNNNHQNFSLEQLSLVERSICMSSIIDFL